MHSARPTSTSPYLAGPRLPLTPDRSHSPRLAVPSPRHVVAPSCRQLQLDAAVRRQAAAAASRPRPCPSSPARASPTRSTMTSPAGSQGRGPPSPRTPRRALPMLEDMSEQELDALAQESERKVLEAIREAEQRHQDSLRPPWQAQKARRSRRAFCKMASSPW